MKLKYFNVDYKMYHTFPHQNIHSLNFAGITSAAVPSLAQPNKKSNAGGKDVGKNILEYVVAHISEFKKLNQDALFQDGGIENEDEIGVGDGGSQMRRQSDNMMVAGVAVSAIPRPR